MLRIPSLWHLFEVGFFLLACSGGQASAQALVIHEPGWQLVGTVPFQNPQSAVYNPFDDSVYVGERGSPEGLHRVLPDLSTEFVVSFGNPTGIVVDPGDGDVFLSQVGPGTLRRVGFQQATAPLWIGEFGGSGDDDPIGMAIAPDTYSGPVLLPGEAIVTDGGYFGTPRSLWKWSPDTPEGETLIISGNGLSQPYDVAVGYDKILFSDWIGAASASLYEVTGIGTITPFQTLSPLPGLTGISADLSTGDFVATNDQQVFRIDAGTGAVDVMIDLPAPYAGAVAGIDMDPNGRTLVVTASSSVFVFERTPICSSNDPATALPLSGQLTTQLTTLNATPPPYDPQTWQPVARHTDFQGGPSSQFLCATPGVKATVAPAIATTPPASQNLYHNQWESDVLIPVIDERVDHMLVGPLIVDVEYPAGGNFQTYQDMPAAKPVIPAGTRVSSHLIHFDTVGSNDLTYGAVVVVFETPIRALITRGETLSESDMEVGLEGYVYSNAPSVSDTRGMELGDPTDFVQVSADGRTLTFGMRVMNWLDEIRVITESPDPLTQPYVATTTPIAGVDEVTYDNCSSAWYRFTFQMPPGAKNPELYLTANVDDQGVLFLNGQRVSGLMTEPGCDPIDPTNPNDGCYALQDTGSDGVDNAGDTILTAPTADELLIDDASLFIEGENELVFAVCGDASAYEPTGLEFEAFLLYDPAATSYCTAKLDTAGCAPQIAGTGTPSATSANAFDVTAVDVQNLKPGLMFYGFAQAALPWNGGTLCVFPPLRRTSIQFSGGSPSGSDCTGTFAFDFNDWFQSGLDPALTVGTDVYAQYWYRDPADGFGSGLSNALSFELCP